MSAMAEPGVEAAFEVLLRFAEQAHVLLVAQSERIAELELASATDPLTGLANGRGFSDFLRRTLASAARHGEGGMLVYLDVDDLKGVNDRYGHDAGNAVLRHVAGVLVSHTRRSDLVARLHGDEFAMLLTHASATNAAERVRLLVEEVEASPLEHGRASIAVRVSVGLARYGARTTEAALLRRADSAMYRRKRASKRDAGSRARQP